MATPIPIRLQYRCQLPGGTKAGPPVFNDLSSTRRRGLLEQRVGLGRLLTVPRVLGEAVEVNIAEERDLADPVEQQAVAAVLGGNQSRLVIAGRVVEPDPTACVVLPELQQLANAGAWFAPERPAGDIDSTGRKDDLRAAVELLVSGLHIRRAQVAALLNAAPSWRQRAGSKKGFTQRSIGHYVTGGAPQPARTQASDSMNVDLSLEGQGNGTLAGFAALRSRV